MFSIVIVDFISLGLKVMLKPKNLNLDLIVLFTIFSPRLIHLFGFGTIFWHFSPPSIQRQCATPYFCFAV
jgi:hypothetical protein